MKKILNVGVLGAAKIAKTHIIPAMNNIEQLNVWGVSSRELSKAKAYIHALEPECITHQIIAVESYEAMINHPEIDVIYNPLPNHLHVELSLKAIEAGKHVLCEKPLALNAGQAKQLALACAQNPKLKVMEAFMYRFHPQWQQVKQWITSGELGDVQSVSSQFCYHNSDPNNIRNHVDAGGGALMDIGCYGISVARMVLGCEPKKVIANAVINSIFGVDDMTHCLMDFEGVFATVMVGTKVQRSQYVHIEGSAGRIIMSHPFYCDDGDERTITLITDDKKQTLTFGSEIDHYQLMLEAFAHAINNDTPVPISLQDSEANMVVIDAAFQSIKKGCWVDLNTTC